MRDCKGFVISKRLAEVIKYVYFIETDDEVLFPFIEGKTVLDQMLEAGAVIEEGRN